MSTPCTAFSPTSRTGREADGATSSVGSSPEAARVVGLYDGPSQVGFARAYTDGVTVVYLAAVYVLGGHRVPRAGTELVREMVENGPYAGVKWLLHTTDAHALYRKFGFTDPSAKVLERGG